MKFLSARARASITIALVISIGPLAEVTLRLVPPGYDTGHARAQIERLLMRVEGIVDEPSHDPGTRTSPEQRALNPYYGFDQPGGFDLLEDYVAMDRRPDREKLFIILVCGGSIPEIFTAGPLSGSGRLEELLRDGDLVDGRNIKICRLARAGYKQPQQLQKLTYFLARGCRPDLVINIDGLNEVRAGPRNLLFGMHPTWPSSGHWLHLTSGPASSPRTLEAYYAAQRAQEALVRKARAVLDGVALRSAILGHWKQRQLDRLTREWFQLHDRYLTLLGEQREVAHPGDRQREAALDESVDVWSESSRLMHALCRDRGILYLHLLQPTLHDEGSKIISEQERATGLGGSEFDPQIKASYDLLRAAGARLVADGVPFVDTSMMFADVSEPLYYDRAHLGKEGNRLLAERIATELHDRY